MKTKLTTWDDKSVGWYRKKERYHHKLWDHVHKVIALRQCKSVLEIGGGPGRLSTSVERYTGVDISQPAILAGRKRYPNATLIHANWIDMDIVPFVGQFDLVAALAVIEHCDKHDLFLSKILDVRPRVVIVSYFWNLRQNGALRRERYDPQGCEFVEHRHSCQQVEGLLNSRGLGGMYRVDRIRFGRVQNLVDAILTIEPTEQWRTQLCPAAE